MPVTDDLRQYRAIEIHRLDNLMLDEIPAQTVERLNAGIVKEIKSLNHFDIITEVDDAKDVQWKQTNQPANEIAVARPHPTLVIEGYIDDYTPGIPKLRYIEKGNNHAILTVRITLKDKQTARVLGQKNISIENSRVTSNVERMTEKSAEEVARYVRRSTDHYEESKEARTNVRK
jgi:ribosomal protein S8